MAPSPLLLRNLGLKDYQTVWDAMRDFTDTRTTTSMDEAWLVEHPPVFTLGMNGREEHLLAPGDIPVIPVDRGGQVTYHGPGQAVLYLLLDLRRRGWGVRQLVSEMENSVIDLLAAHGVRAEAKPDAPGVYVNGAKIASLGLRVRRGRCYHGIALNVDLDLEPFSRINPCGYQGQTITRLVDLGIVLNVAESGRALAMILAERLDYRMQPETDGLPGEQHG